MTTNRVPRIDTNVILRFLIGEPPEQAALAAALFHRAGAGLVTLIVDDVIVAEVIWTLKSYYRMSRQEISGIVLEVLSIDGVECRDGGNVARALALLAERNIDFADALVATRMRDEGELEIFSFDRDFDRIPGIRRMVPG